MKKNVSGQVIGVQMVSATDGSAFTGSVTVHVTGDGGIQATGSVGSGACTHEGNGFHTYAPAQAETNYDHIGFTFTGTGAVPVTIQVYPTFPQTGDNYARLGAPAGASVSEDIATVKSETATILADTNELQTNQGDWATATGFSTHSAADVWSVATRVLTAGTNISLAKGTGITGFNDLSAAQVNAEVDTALADVGLTTTVTGRIDASISSVSSGGGLDAAGVRAAIGLASANLDTQLEALPTAVENADALLNRDMSAVTDSNARSPLNALRAIRNKTSIAGGTLTVTKEDDSTSAWTASVSTDAAAEPIIGVDPA